MEHQRADGQIRHVVIVHDVEVNQVGARRENCIDLVAETREIGGQNRWGNPIVTHARELYGIKLGTPVNARAGERLPTDPACRCRSSDRSRFAADAASRDRIEQQLPQRERPGRRVFEQLWRKH